MFVVYVRKPRLLPHSGSINLGDVLKKGSFCGCVALHLSRKMMQGATSTTSTGGIFA